MNRLTLAVGISLMLAAVAAIRAAEETSAAGSKPDAIITVDTGDPGIKISKNLWGLFFEEINYAGDGGLYAELVRHRNFEGNQALDGWSLDLNDAKGEIAVDTKVRMNDARKQSLRVNVESVEDGGTVNVVNGGYWGVPVREGEEYTYTIFVKSSDKFAGKSLTVSLRNAALDRIYAEAEVGKTTTDWQKLTGTLVPNGTDNKGRLVVTAEGTGEFWLGTVSLFPPTYRDQPNGLRPDLTQMLVDLKPSFLRFPGGCFVEGKTLEDAFRFADTIGPTEERKGRDSFWGYYSTDGLGYYEYLRLTEDLGADPIFCLNPGGNDRASERVAIDKLGPWLDEAVAAVEFAIGPADSEWGAKRAAMGHPEPFKFKTYYLQIGNETEFGPEDYGRRFAAFRDHVKQAYPADNVQIIADSWGTRWSQGVETFAIDFHEYPSWGGAIADRDVHDNAPRGEPFIFEGEYAARSGSGILQALSEAVFMMGLEENGDEVILASYAPLFGNVAGCQWHPNMIYFDNHRAMGSISYYVQQMYSTKRGVRLLPTTVNQEKSQDAETPEEPSGSVGFATWGTEAEFKDLQVVVDGKAVYKNDLNDAASIAEWDSNESSDWKIRDGALRQSSRNIDCRIWLPGCDWTKYEVHAKARKIDGAEGFVVKVHVKDANEYVWVNFGGWGNTEHGVERAQEGMKLVVDKVGGSIDTDRWYDVLIQVDGMKVAGSLDGKKLLDVDLTDLKVTPEYDVFASAVADVEGDVLVRVVNIAEESKRVILLIDGDVNLSGKGTAITLAAENRMATQSLDVPERYTPTTSEVETVGREFSHEFPACSFTILRLKQKGE